MRKNFLTYQKYALAETSNEATSRESFFAEYLVNSGNFVYLPQEVSFENLLSRLEQNLKDEYKTETEFFEIGEIKGIKILSRKFLSLQKEQIILFLKTESTLFYGALPLEVLENEKNIKDFSFQKFFSGFLNDYVKKFIDTQIAEIINSEENRFVATDVNIFSKEINFEKRAWFFANREEDELLLTFIKIKALLSEDETDKKLTWYYVLTTKEHLLAGFNNDLIFRVIALEQIPMKIEHGLSKTVSAGAYSWQISGQKTKLFEEIEDFCSAAAERKILETARLNTILSAKLNDVFGYVNFLLEHSGHPIKDLFEFYLLFRLKSDKISAETDNLDVEDLIRNVAAAENFSVHLANFFETWQWNENESLFFLSVFKNTLKDKDICKITDFYRLVYNKFFKKRKDEIEKILFEVYYAEHLIDCGQKDEAEKILSKILENLNDEFLYVLPVNTSQEIAGKGPVLRVKVLDLLSEISGNKQYKIELAKLQPLDIQRITKLAEAKIPILSVKAQNILEVLQPGDFIPIAAVSTEEYRKLTPETLELLKIEPLRQKSFYRSFTRWIASVKQPDTKDIKKFAEPLTEKNYPLTFEIVRDISLSLNIPSLQTFIARGDYSVGIRTIEGEPNVLLIGIDHLSDNSPYYLTPLELKFAVGAELVYLVFHFTKITSLDIWRGLMEKGNFVLDTFLTTIPLITGLGKILKNISKLNKIGEKIEKTAQLIKKSDNIITTSLKSLEIFKQKLDKKDNKSLKDEELIAVSRLMQFTADRGGLIFCGEISSAVRAMFLTSPVLAHNIEYVKKYGLAEFVLQKNEENKFIYENTAIRIAQLFRFYLSDDYENIRKKLIKFF